MKKFSFIFLCSLFLHCQQDIIEFRTVKKPQHIPPSSALIAEHKDDKKVNEEEEKLCAPPCKPPAECVGGKCTGAAQTNNTDVDVKKGQSYYPVSTVYKKLNNIDPYAPN